MSNATAFWLGQLVGGLIMTFAMSRVFLWFIPKRLEGLTRLQLAHFGSWLTIAIVGGFGFAEDELFVWTAGFRTHLLLPQIFWFIMDVVRGKGEPEEPEEA